MPVTWFKRYRPTEPRFYETGKATPFVRIKICIGDATRYLRYCRDHATASLPEVCREIAELFIQQIRRYAPEWTGALKNSVDYYATKTVLRIAMLYYWRYTHEGTRASPGRFVWQINKRLVKPSKRNPDIGMHPGIKRTRWFDNVMAWWDTRGRREVRRRFNLTVRPWIER